MTFADPYKTVPEVARLLRPGGLLAFSTNTPIVDLVWPAEAEHPGEQLLLNYWEELHEIKPPNEPIGFQLPYGDWISLFRQNELAIEALLELRPCRRAQQLPQRGRPRMGQTLANGAHLEGAT
jgi:SAM-dependent methyltransferase